MKKENLIYSIIFCLITLSGATSCSMRLADICYREQCKSRALAKNDAQKQALRKALEQQKQIAKITVIKKECMALVPYVPPVSDALLVKCRENARIQAKRERLAQRLREAQEALPINQDAIPLEYVASNQELIADNEPVEINPVIEQPVQAPPANTAQVALEINPVAAPLPAPEIVVPSKPIDPIGALTSYQPQVQPEIQNTDTTMLKIYALCGIGISCGLVAYMWHKHIIKKRQLNKDELFCTNSSVVKLS